MTTRTTMRSRTGTKLYAVRDAKGRFKDIQTYKRAHAADMRHKSAAEVAAKLGEAEKKAAHAKSGAAELACSSMEKAGAATRAMRRSVKKAVTGLKQAAGKVAKQVLEAAAPAKPVKAAKRRAPKASGPLPA